MSANDWRDVKLGDLDQVVQSLVMGAATPDQYVHFARALSESLAGVVDGASKRDNVKPVASVGLQLAAHTIRGVPDLLERALRERGIL
jgi:hypothetical protein